MLPRTWPPSGWATWARKLASAGHYPSIDILDSKSRVKDLVTDVPHQAAARSVLRTEAAYREKEDLIMVGAYQRGSDPHVDAAIQFREPMVAYLQQAPTEHSTLEQTTNDLLALGGAIDTSTARPS